MTKRKRSNTQTPTKCLWSAPLPKFTILSLPREIRERIYDFHFSDYTITNIPPPGKFRKHFTAVQMTSGGVLRLLRVCKMIHGEAKERAAMVETLRVTWHQRDTSCCRFIPYDKLPCQNHLRSIILTNVSNVDECRVFDYAKRCPYVRLVKLGLPETRIERQVFAHDPACLPNDRWLWRNIAIVVYNSRKEGRRMEKETKTYIPNLPYFERGGVLEFYWGCWFTRRGERELYRMDMKVSARGVDINRIDHSDDLDSYLEG